MAAILMMVEGVVLRRQPLPYPAFPLLTSGDIAPLVNINLASR
jgi:hypothetical protein